MMILSRTLVVAALTLTFLFLLPLSAPAQQKGIRLPEKTEEIQKKTQLPEKPLVSPRDVKPLPDLVVSRVWLDRCRISFELHNQGRGSIPDDKHRNGSVRVYYLPRPPEAQYPSVKDFSFTVVDPRGALKSPGGTVNYTTGVRLATPHMVEVDVDNFDTIAESHDRNNRPEPVWLNPPLSCRMGAAPGTTPTK